jgi:hypothetical protein
MPFAPSRDRYFPNQPALVRENACLWTTSDRPSPLYQLWDTWQAWLEAYRTLMVHMQELAEVCKLLKTQERKGEGRDEPDNAFAVAGLLLPDSAPLSHRSQGDVELLTSCGPLWHDPGGGCPASDGPSPLLRSPQCVYTEAPSATTSSA